MKDRLSISFKTTRCVIASLKSLSGIDDVSYNEVYRIYSDVTERLTGYREPSIARSDLDSDSLDKIEADVRLVVGDSIDADTDEGRHKIQMFIMEAVSQAETISRMKEDIETGGMEVVHGSQEL